MNPWESHPHIWKNKTAFFTYLRGALRGAVWNTNPAKLDFKNKSVSPPPPDYVGRAKSGAECALTGRWVNKSNLEVDHIHGNVPLNDWYDVLPFIQHLTCLHDNMQLVSADAHKIKSYAERHNISFTDAAAEKYAVEQMKASSDDQIILLVQNGLLQPKEKSTAKQRRVLFVKLYKMLNTPRRKRNT